MSVTDLTRMDGICNDCVLPLVEDDYEDYSTGVTSLMHAAYKGNVQCMKELITAGAALADPRGGPRGPGPPLTPRFGGPSYTI